MNTTPTTTEAPAHAAEAHAHQEPQSFWSKYVFSTDHKIIGLQYGLTGMFMAIVGVYMSYVFRMHLANPTAHIPFYGVLSPAAYNSLVTNHGTIMIFWVAMPVLLAGLGNYCIPLMIGCDDMVFPRVNRLSFQIFLLSTVLLLLGFIAPGGAFGGAWTSYGCCSRSSPARRCLPCCFPVSRTNILVSRWRLCSPRMPSSASAVVPSHRRRSRAAFI